MNDAQAIRDLVAEWTRATLAADVDRILPLMAEDVEFYVHGQPIMRGRAAFEKGVRAVLASHRVDSHAEVQQVEVSGNLAYCTTHLRVTITPLAGGATVHKAGHVLSVYRKNAAGKWQLARDANMLS
ncbi:YybH family protein [Pseudoduganella violaceinigra]|uniref:YybH family protein n=1 Tax=Pseudoduganella violaceinigra TaxID=246602 RepID=UPI0003FE4CF7|nr:SgcJ/EcaC family oxidoreductase [Pseudoduganella violaceinigra]